MFTGFLRNRRVQAGLVVFGLCAVVAIFGDLILAVYGFGPLEVDYESTWGDPRRSSIQVKLKASHTSPSFPRRPSLRGAGGNGEISRANKAHARTHTSTRRYFVDRILTD